MHAKTSYRQSKEHRKRLDAWQSEEGRRKSFKALVRLAPAINRLRSLPDRKL